MPASYSASIKSFLTYQDQPGVNNIVPDPSNPGQTVDLTIDRAKITNEIHDEVVAIESTMGVTGGKALIPGISQFGRDIAYLYNNKSAGRVDPSNNAIYPTPPPSHNHVHAYLSGNSADVHPQYVRVDGRRGFSAQVSAPSATNGSQLTTLSQVQNAGYLNSPQVHSAIQSALNAKSAHPVTGPAPQRYRMTGGYFYGPSDSNGMIWIDYSAANFAGILSLVFMKNPFPGESMLGWYTYQYEEDQLLLQSISNRGAMVQFIEDIVVDRSANVALTWMVVGV
jgi:hypothetical protein